MTFLLLAALAAVPAHRDRSAPVPLAVDSTTYRVVLLQAAPGRLLDLIALYRDRMRLHDAANEPRPLFARHAQGDHWDLLLVYPIGTMEEYYAPARQARWAQAAASLGYDEARFAAQFDALVAWQEELFVTGPPVGDLRARNAEAGFYHLEMFVARAGMRDSLLRQRRMENDYLRRIHRPDNLVFTRIGGAAWDLFTIGFYRNLQHYAEPAGVDDAADDDAARAAGFEGRNTIGSYLRTFLQSHHDTLLNRVR